MGKLHGQRSPTYEYSCNNSFMVSFFQQGWEML